MKVSIDEKVVKEYVELKPCPFCGSENIELHFDPGSYGYTPAKSFVLCSSCGAEMKRTAYSETALKKIKLKAINAWNRRGGI